LSVKTQYQIPSEFQGCHTAIVDGYVVEGHVPAAEINRMLTEKPDIIGIAVPGMPPGSPGMGVAELITGIFNVVSFDKMGNVEIYASYPK
jgi:hypothetical protein